MDKEKIDLNAPAFGDGAQKVSDLAAVVEPAEEVVTEPAVEEVPETSEEESKVPYSRFKKFHDEAKQYEREALEWKAKAEALAQATPPKEENQTELPSYWVKLYGDSPEAVEAWKIQSQENERLKQEAREEALKAVQESRQQEDIQIKQNLEVIDDKLETLSAYIGRDLTSKEESALLDVVDEYTPKDDDGNYLGDTISFEKAWEILQLKQAAAKAPKRQARDEVAALSSNPTQGTPDADEKNKAFNPLDWNAYQKRI